ncbi:carboxy-terminal protease for penicillin-binding protein 3 [Halobacteriovorax marinus SJ]|uniref:Carboxy-terminal protease for penicillin-binding protein 3 n=1 Tax=Halobacteriovorax marinus (strain ATCC BAA-682 / DSM 15412 / SJ) TaxID=862908 RepID=E1X4X8_HALMS|nr:carboxy terminal-processing peptidase [Halobacteriovorax marinus]CBW27204.1 carboxy-terminal protease for penicillin-binding protein 3 [Halobacteriovorax marinus SJ]
MKRRLNFLLILSLVLSLQINAKEPKKLAQTSFKKKEEARSVDLITADIVPNVKKEKIIGNILRNALETYHYRKLKINNDLSVKAYDQFFKKIDYGKQFFLKSDVKLLSKYKGEMHNEMLSGKHSLVNDAIKIFRERVVEVDKVRQEIFKKEFDWSLDESLELDPEKRDFSKNHKELKNHWRKVFKQATLNRYLSLKEEQDELKNPKKDDKKKDKKKKKAKKEEKVEILTDAQIRKKAHEGISKKYKSFFSRLMKDDRNDYEEKFFNAIASIYDPHTQYLPPKRKEDFDIDISGSLEGIGAVLSEEDPYIKVVKIVPGGAAWRQKELEVDDLILAVGQETGDFVDLVGMRVDDAVRYIRGKKGTIVKLKVKKADGSRKQIEIERDVVQIGESFAKSSVLELKGLGLKVGYIHVPKFYRDFENSSINCTADVRAELERIKTKGVDGVILDLRNNGGGALEDAKQMSGLFIEKGPIVQIKNHDGKVDVLNDTDSSVTYAGPLIVMTNRFSASASEILAAALQDYGRAVIVGGAHSHGKGTVQAVLNLNHGPIQQLLGGEMGALKVTIQKFYRVTGGSTQFKGVTPDITIPDPYEYTKSREQDLEYALPWDRVQPLTFKHWDKNKYDLSTLKKRSSKRVKSSKRFSKIQESVEYLTKRREDTKVSLNMQKVIKEDKLNKEMSEKLKLDEQNKDLMVSFYEDSVRMHEEIKKGDEKKWKKDFKDRNDDWTKQLRQDAGLEEALFILNDMIHMQKGEKLTAVK